ncbi:MAG: hypothetical protein V3U87_10120 [Methylococcaceae bacterium]
MDTKISRKVENNLPNSLTDKIIRRKITLKEEDVQGIVFKIAETTNELEQAFCLLHEVYVQEGYTNRHRSRMRLSKYNFHPETTVFIGKKGDKVIITCTLFPDSTFLGLPMDSLYQTELDLLRNQNKKIAEIGALATHSDYRTSNSTLPLLLNKITMTYAIHNLKMDNMVITVNPKHSFFYTSILLFKQIGSLKSCHHVNGEPAIAYSLDLNSVESNSKIIYSKQSKKRNLHQFFFKNKSSCITKPKESTYVWNQKMLTYFFEDKSDIFSSMSKDTLNQVHRQHLLCMRKDIIKMAA